MAVPIDPLTPAAGAGDMFLYVKGARAGVIKGEAQDTAHQDEIDVISWSWGMQATRNQVTGAATGKASIQELKIVKRVDSASTGLMSALRTNESIKEAKLTLRKSGKGQLEYMKILIENGRVVSLTLDGGTPPGSATGKASVQELKIVKPIDSASTGLMSALRTNEPIKEARLTLRKSGKGQLEYLKVVIENARVVSVALDGGTPPGTSQVVEQVAFAFNKITVEYVPQGKDGQGKGGMLFQDEYENAQ